MPTILLNKVSPKGTPVKDITVGSKPVKFARIGSDKVVYDTLSYYTYGTPTITVTYSVVPRKGGTVTPIITYSQTRTRIGYSGTSYGSDTITGTITSFSATGTVQNSSGATINSTTGAVTRSSLGTTYKSAEWVIMKVTITATVNGKSGSKTVDVKMQSNTYTDSGGTTTYGNITAGTITNATVPASGGTKTATAGNGSQTWSKTAVIRTYQTGSTETVTAASSGTNSVSPSVASIQATGSNLGTTIQKQTTLKTQAVTWSANGKSASGTMYVYQAANLVTAVTANSNTFSYANIGAGTTSATPTTNHTPKYTFSSGSTSTTTPSSTYGSLTTSVSYSIVNTTTNGFTACNSSTGVLTATSRGATYGASTRTSATVTKTLKYTWTHTSTYGSSSVNSGNLTKTATCTQGTNKITEVKSVTVNAGAIAYNGGSTVSAAGLTKTSTNTTSATASAVLTLQSGSTIAASTSYGSWSGPTYSWSETDSTGMMSFTSANAATLSVTIAGRAKVVGDTRSATLKRTASFTFTVKAECSSTGAAITKSNTATVQTTINQEANKKITTCTNLVISDFYYHIFPYTSVTYSPSNFKVTATTVNNYTSGASDAATTSDVTTTSGVTYFGTAKNTWSINTSTGAITTTYNSSNFKKDDSIICTARYLGREVQKSTIATQLFDSSYTIDINFVPENSSQHGAVIAFSTSTYLSFTNYNTQGTYNLKPNTLTSIPVNDGTPGNWTVLDSMGNPVMVNTSSPKYIYLYLWNFDNPGWVQIGSFSVQNSPSPNSFSIYGWEGII